MPPEPGTTRPPDGPASPAALPGQYLTFLLGGEAFALPILEVREIVEFSPLTRIPGAPAFIRGVLNLRGGVVPVVDLAARFGQPPCEPTRRTCIVVMEVRLRGELLTLGVLADAVSQVVELAAADLQPPPTFGTPVSGEYLLGMGRVGEGFVLLLDVERALSTAELVAPGAVEGTPT